MQMYLQWVPVCHPLAKYMVMIDCYKTRRILYCTSPKKLSELSKANSSSHVHILNVQRTHDGFPFLLAYGLRSMMPLPSLISHWHNEYVPNPLVQVTCPQTLLANSRIVIERIVLILYPSHIFAHMILTITRALWIAVSGSRILCKKRPCGGRLMALWPCGLRSWWPRECYGVIQLLCITVTSR